MEMYKFTPDELEKFSDDVKAVVLQGLVNSKMLEEKVAYDWGIEHTVIIRKETFFKSIISKLYKPKETNTRPGFYCLIVKRIY